MTAKITHIRDYIRHEYERRAASRPDYHLAEFSKELGLPRTTLSRLLRGVGSINLETAEKIVASLDLNRVEAQHFLGLEGIMTKRLRPGF